MVCFWEICALLGPFFLQPYLRIRLLLSFLLNCTCVQMTNILFFFTHHALSSWKEEEIKDMRGGGSKEMRKERKQGRRDWGSTEGKKEDPVGLFPLDYFFWNCWHFYTPYTFIRFYTFIIYFSTLVILLNEWFYIVLWLYLDYVSLHMSN